MRLVLIVAAVAVLGGLGWWLSGSGDADAPPVSAGDRDVVDRPEVPAAPLERENSREALPATPRPAGGADPAPGENPDSAPPPAPAERPEGMGRFHVEVWDRPAGERVAGFRYVLVHADGTRDAEMVEGGEHTLTVKLGSEATLMIEAEGFEPSGPLELRLTDAEPEQHRRVALEPAAAFAGVELWLQAPDQSPVEFVEVTACTADAANPTAPGDMMWVRRTAGERGVYRLPELRAGDYRFRLQALKATGQIATHLPHVESVLFGGTEHVRRHIQLRPGALLDLEVTDATGAQLGRTVNLRLIAPDGSVLPVRWIARVDGHMVERSGGLPGLGRARLGEPVPPGAYRLELRVGDGPVTERAVPLAAGGTQTISIRLDR